MRSPTLRTSPPSCFRRSDESFPATSPVTVIASLALQVWVAVAAATIQVATTTVTEAAASWGHVTTNAMEAVIPAMATTSQLKMSGHRLGLKQV